MEIIRGTCENKYPTTLHLLMSKIIKTMKSTCKADKYVRLIANIVKLIRTVTSETKIRYSKIYK
jgi:hypothetical protein